MADKTPIRGAYNGSSLTGLAEYATGDTVSVGFGGTGATSLTDNGILIGNATSAIQTSGDLTFDGTTFATTAFTATSNVSLDGGSFVFNESGADKDFRIEGDTAANLFMADASTDRIGIGTATPSHLLDVEGVANVATCIITPVYCVASEYVLPSADGSAGQVMCTDGSGALAFATNTPASPGGSDTYVQFNDSDSFGGSANLTWDDTTLKATNLCTTANAVLGGDLTIAGDDLTMGTNTSGALLVADGTNFNPVVMSGDASISTAGAVTLAATNTNLTTLANVTTVGTIGSGTWQGTAIATGYIATTLTGKTLTGATLTSPVLNGTLSGTAFLDEDNMASDSAIAAASQQSIKAYVDAVASGLDMKCSSHVATASGLTAEYDNGSSGVGATLCNSQGFGLSALSIDGQTMVAGERVLVKNQTAACHNGIYTVTTVGDGSTRWVITRATDFDSSTEVTSGAFTFIETGSTNGDQGFVMTSDGTITIGTTAINWTQFSGAGQITAGAGMTKSGNTLNVIAGSNITVNADDVALSTTITGLSALTSTNLTGTLQTAAQANVTSVGTLTSLNSSGNVSFDGGTFIFNESGADKDFRIEGDTEANLFITDASVDRVGIGTATPSHLLDVEGVAHAATCFVSADVCATTKVVSPAICVGGQYVLPAADGSAGEILCTDGSGAIAFAEAASSGHTIAEEGSVLASRTCLNFVGSAVTATDNSGTNATDVTVCATSSLLGVRMAAGTACCITLSSAAVGESLVSDTSPQLGGDLDVNGNSIVSDASNENIPITPHGTGSVVISKLSVTGDTSLDGGSFVFNESGADKDFRIEGDTATNLFIADASTDRIGIGTATPSHLLDVEGVANVATCIVTPKICIPTAGFSSGYTFPSTDGSAGQVMCTDGSGALAFATNTPASPGGSDTYIQFNNSSAFGGSANLTWDDTTLATTAFTATGNVSLDGGTFVFNDSGADKDFRIEGDTDTELFIADASTNRIGIGTLSPTHLLDVNGVANVSTCIVTPKLCIPTEGFFVSGYTLPASDGSAGQLMCTNGSGTLAFATASGVTLTGSTDNTVATVTGSNALAGEANLTFDGTTLLIGTSVAATADTNTSIGFPGSDVMTFTEGGVESMRMGSFVCCGGGEVDPTGRILMGSTVSVDVEAQASRLQVLGGNTADGAITVGMFSNDAEGAKLKFIKSRSATVGCNTIIQDGDQLGSIQFHAADGGDMVSRGASIMAVVNGSVGGANDVPTDLRFATNDNAGGDSERMRITSTGKVGIGTTAPVSPLEVEGTAASPTSADGAAGVAYFVGDTSDSGVAIGSYNASPWNNWIQSQQENGTVSALALQPRGGNVGIGTTAPATTLDVYGAATFQNTVCVGATTCDAGIVFCLGRGRIFGCCETHVCSRLILQTCGDGSFSTIQTYHLRGSCVNGCICTGYCLCAGTCIGSPTKNFEIEHPLASDESPNKYNMMHLVHSTLEGPEYGVYYRGSAQLNSGAVKVDLPEYFEALAEKTDATVQLTSVGGISNLTIKLDDENIFTNNSFCVCTDDAGSQTQCFHWIVNGRRIDKHILCAIAQGDRPGAYDDGRLCTTRWEYRGEMENINGLETMTCAELDDFIDFNNTWDNDDPDFVTGYENVSKANKIIMIGNAFDAIQNSAEGGKTDFSDEEE